VELNGSSAERQVSNYGGDHRIDAKCCNNDSRDQ